MKKKDKQANNTYSAEIKKSNNGRTTPARREPINLVLTVQANQYQV